MPVLPVGYQYHEPEFQHSMTLYAHIFAISEVHLWGLDAGQRLRRQLNEINKASTGDIGQIHWVDQPGDLPATGRVLLFNGRFVFENRTIKGVIDTPDSVLQYEGETTAAFVDAAVAVAGDSDLRARMARNARITAEALVPGAVSTRFAELLVQLTRSAR